MDFDESLIEALAERRCLVVVGAGLSAADASMSSWDSLLDGMRRDVFGTSRAKPAEEAKALGRANDYLGLAELLHFTKGNDWLHARIKAEFTQAVDPTACAAHNQVISWDPRVVI